MPLNLRVFHNFGLLIDLNSFKSFCTKSGNVSAFSDFYVKMILWLV